MSVLYALLYVVAIVCFTVHALGRPSRVHLLAVGFIFVTLVPLLQILRSL